jgi:hypothetical protein
MANNHLAGIIPVAGQPLDFNFPWHDCLMPVAQDYHAIERAVHTAALAGCDTIWIVLDRATAPIIRKKVGEWVYDPEYVWKKPMPFAQKREIPIYYIPIKTKDKGRRDSNGWSALYAGKVISAVSRRISKWTSPDRYFVVSPYGIIDDQIIKDNRSEIRSGQPIAFSVNNTSFKDNTYLPFVMTEQERKAYHEFCRVNNTGDDADKDWSYIFSTADIQKYRQVTPNWYYNISKWDQYAAMIGQNSCIRPKYMVSHKWYGLVKLKINYLQD